jgi:hypothetical protein
MFGLIWGCTEPVDANVYGLSPSLMNEEPINESSGLVIVFLPIAFPPT